MSAPIVFISHFRVKEGKLDGLRQLWREVTKQLVVDGLAEQARRER